jgi:eukaryotic-like serine/threonine-protein kinase
MTLSVGDRLGPYEVTSEIGVGRMGQVYRAHDTRLNREVAIKVSTELCSDRFEREARRGRALPPQICTLFAIRPNYLAMSISGGESRRPHCR